MNNVPKKFLIKIPYSIILIYCNEKKILTLLGVKKNKSLKLNNKIFIIKKKRLIFISKFSNSQKISNKNKKIIKRLQGTTTILIKQLIIETSNILYLNLKFVGVGYRVLNIEDLKKKLLLFKLGFSHFIYFKIPKKIKIFCLKQTRMFIFGDNYKNISEVSSIIRSYKYPEPYKGKGILYENEKIKLKEGKKV